MRSIAPVGQLRRSLGVALVLVLLACSKPAPQTATDPFAELQEISRRLDAVTAPHRSTGNLLGELVAMQMLAKELETKDDSMRNFAGQILAELFASLGRPTEAHRAYRTGWPPPTPAPPDGSALAGYEPRPAIDTLAELAAEQRVVFINEAHHVPQHRAFSILLLSRLRAAGFTHFAAETLYEEDLEALQKRGYPIAATGYYIREPLYADLVRIALALGFEVVAYDLHGPPAEREPGQAQRLFERVLRDDPAARLVAHVGLAHNEESGKSFGGLGAMAFHFRRLSGIDPLTIDQTRMTEAHDRDFESSTYRWVTDELGIAEPTVFRKASGEPWKPQDDGRDVTVFHPRTRLENNRPQWMLLGGLRHHAKLPPDVCANSFPCMVEARASNEGADAIPFDSIAVFEGEPVPALVLPGGRFEVRVRDAEGKEIRAFVVGMP